MGAPINYSIDDHILWSILLISFCIIGILFIICSNLDEKRKK